MADETKNEHRTTTWRDLAATGTRLTPGNFLVQLFDLQMRQIVTTRMLPFIYGSAIALAGLLSVYSIVWAFEHGFWEGIAWLLLVGPGLFLAVVITVRVLLEFVLIVFRIACYMEVMGGQIEGIADQTEDIAGDLPRIMFWRKWGRERREPGH
ncbi:MAG: DUF4282 domain-containing protein [Salinisphaera sp.]|nr:DUF4282 domain-containing protein [Salinisphaera sp.]MDN5939708.1 DUF4282 domain-containing protein [Salinisphaera sp.]